MRKLVLSLLGASAAAFATAANAVVIVPGAPLIGDPSTSFIVSPTAASSPSYVGPIAATIGHTGIAAGDFSDTFQFTIGQNGTGSGSLTTTVNVGDFLGVTDLDITSVVINGVINAIQTLRDIDGNPCTTEGVGTCGATETFAANDVPIAAGVLNTIVVTGVSRGLGSYGGNLTFSPARTSVPEPATWAMMLLGFGAIGFQMRRRKSTALRQFA